MPTYEFRCPDGHEFEKFYRSIGSAASQAVCPVCGLEAERMMSATGFAFKGSGFYLTDYGKNAHRGEAPPSKGGDASVTSATESSKSDSSGDTKGSSEKKESANTNSAPAPAAETKKAEPKAESKPASTPKPSSGE